MSFPCAMKHQFHQRSCNFVLVLCETSASARIRVQSFPEDHLACIDRRQLHTEQPVNEQRFARRKGN